MNCCDSCRGVRLCPPAECSVFSEIFGKSATFIGPTESSAPTRRGTNSPKGFRVCSCLLQTPHNESDRQNRTGLPRVRQAGSVGVEKKEEREERKEKIGLLTSMSISANHVRTMNESQRICEHLHSPAPLAKGSRCVPKRKPRAHRETSVRPGRWGKKEKEVIGRFWSR